MRLQLLGLAIALLSSTGAATAEPLEFVTVRSYHGAAVVDGAFGCWVVRVYEDEAGRRLALLLLLDPFDANSVSTIWKDSPVRGSNAVNVTVNGTPFSSEKELSCFVNGPYGRIRELAIRADDLQRLASGAGQGSAEFIRAWRSVIEPRLFKVQGRFVDGVREGKWTYSLKGMPYVQKTYSDGKLSGVVRNYYPSGTVQSERSYVNGLPNGRWTYYQPDGTITASVVVDFMQMRSQGTSASRIQSFLLSPHNAPQQKTGFVWRLEGPSEFLVAGQHLELNQ